MIGKEVFIEVHPETDAKKTHDESLGMLEEQEQKFHEDISQDWAQDNDECFFEADFEEDEPSKKKTPTSKVGKKRRARKPLWKVSDLKKRFLHQMTMMDM